MVSPVFLRCCFALHTMAVQLAIQSKQVNCFLFTMKALFVPVCSVWMEAVSTRLQTVNALAATSSVWICLALLMHRSVCRWVYCYLYWIEVLLSLDQAPSLLKPIEVSVNVFANESTQIPIFINGSSDPVMWRICCSSVTIQFSQVCTLFIPEGTFCPPVGVPLNQVLPTLVTVESVADSILRGVRMHSHVLFCCRFNIRWPQILPPSSSNFSNGTAYSSYILSPPANISSSYEGMILFVWQSIQ